MKIIGLILILSITLFFIPSGKAQVESDKSKSGKSVITLQVSPGFDRFNCNYFNENINRSYGLAIGLLYSYKLIDKVKFDISLGSGIVYHQLGVSYALNYENLEWTTDKDNDSVYISEQCNNVLQEIRIKSLEVPLMLNLNLKVNPKTSIYLCGGGSYCISYIEKSYDISMKLTRSGYYPKYNLTLTEIDVDNSPYFYPSEKLITYAGNLNLRNNFSFFAATGVKFNLSEGFAFSLGLNHYRGLRNLSDYHSVDRKNLVQNDRTILPLQYNSDQIKINSTGIEIGIYFQF